MTVSTAARTALVRSPRHLTSHCRRVATSSTSKVPSSPRGRSIFDLGLIAAAGIGVSGVLIWSSQQRQRQQQHQQQMVANSNKDDGRSFTVPVVSQTGAPSTKTLTRLSLQETNARLKEHEVSYAVQRKGNPVFRYDTNSLPSNSPIEDDSCCVILERDPSANTQGDLVFWGVFDGHSGWHTSRLLSSSLVSYCASELDQVFRGTQPYLDLLKDIPPESVTPALAEAANAAKSTRSFWSLLSSSPPPKPDLDLYDPILQKAIKTAFERMDNDIKTTPIRMMEKLKREGKLSGKPSPDKGEMDVAQNEGMQALLPALSGSCALLAFLDAGRNKLHVAWAGDSRALMGTWVPDASGGKWRADVLTEDQTGRNMKEVERVRSEHPESEADTVIARGRVLGSLEPTRAFGDCRYKWPIGMQEKLAEAFHPGSVRGRPRNYLTPPYVTATPEVTTIDLSKGLSQAPRKSLASFLPVSSSSEPPGPQATRFLVLATDGLYDRLNNDEIVSLVGAHLSGVRGIQSRQQVLSHVAPASTNDLIALDHNGPHLTHVPRQEPIRGEGPVFTFEDGNLATHLVRNALGGAKREQVSVLLSIPSPLSRRYRDDITVTVILLSDPSQAGEGGAGGVYRREDDSPLKAKL
ncbi:hypothetical protein OIO90_005322 [Microbotryomycetes sp. JL221]|nr:hypothetical protein OIO90_005322 [Microbotryomycetes sp. JL221]